MNLPENEFRPHRLWILPILAIALVLSVGLLLYGVTAYFRLGSETAALRQSLMTSLGGTWDRRIAVNIGSLTMGWVRLGTRWLALPAEPRAALQTLRGAEVGVYRLRTNPTCLNRAAVFAAADKAMAGRGWSRIVGVTQDSNLVAVYVHRRGVSSKNLKCCCVVLHERDLVVASARGNPAPLMELAALRLEPRLDQARLSLVE